MGAGAGAGVGAPAIARISWKPGQQAQRAQHELHLHVRLQAPPALPEAQLQPATPGGTLAAPRPQNERARRQRAWVGGGLTHKSPSLAMALCVATAGCHPVQNASQNCSVCLSSTHVPQALPPTPRATPAHP